MPTEWNRSPWDISYTYTTPGYSNYGSRGGVTGGAGGGGAALSTSGTVPYGDLARRTNALMTEQARYPFLANLPNYANLVGQASDVTGQQLRGEVPADVRAQLGTAAAERGIRTGMAPGQNANAAWLRALGLTSVGLQNQGMQGLHQLVADTPVPQLFNPASLFVPEHLANLELGAAGAGLRAGVAGGGGVSSISLPGGSLGGGNLGTPSWNRYPAQTVAYGPGGGAGVGSYDSQGLFNSPTFSGGMYTGGGGGSIPSGNAWGAASSPNAGYSYMGPANPTYGSGGLGDQGPPITYGSGGVGDQGPPYYGPSNEDAWANYFDDLIGG